MKKISESKNIPLKLHINSNLFYFIYNKKLHLFSVLCLMAVTSVLTLVFVKEIRINKSLVNKPKYYMPCNSKYLQNVHIVLKRLGWEQVPENSTDWDLHYTAGFCTKSKLSYKVNDLKLHQRVTRVPGSFTLTDKRKLSVSKNKYIPRSFLLPKEKKKFLDYAKTHTDALFLQKLNTHRGVKLKNVSDMDISGRSFAQEFMKNPFLIDGYKFDIGIYMVLISVNPLRIYWYKEDVLIRFCRHQYKPFNASDFDSYALTNNYKPTWKIPSLAYYFNGLGFGMKGSFDSFMRTLDIDPEIIWNDVTAAIADVFLMKEPHIIKQFKNRSAVNYFELLRVDLLLNEDLKVYITEVNLGPNLFAADKPTNTLLYQQLLYNVFKITGIASRYKTQQDPESSMISAPKNIATWGSECSVICKKCDSSEHCALCPHCRTKELTDKLMAIHTENLNRGAFRRLFPPRLEPGNSPVAIMPTISKLSESNRLLYLWYQGKCNDDVTWCT